MLVKVFIDNNYTDQSCCYFYGSVPRNDSNCVVQTSTHVLSYAVYNPHDIFSNLTMRWFRNMGRDASSLTVELTDTQNEYH